MRTRRTSVNLGRTQPYRGPLPASHAMLMTTSPDSTDQGDTWPPSADAGATDAVPDLAASTGDTQDQGPALEAAEAWTIHRTLREFDHRNAHAAMLANASTHFHAIVLNRSVDEALVVWRDCVAIDPAFEPGAETRVQLARMAIEAGEPKAAIELVSGFDNRFPDHARVPGAYAIAHDALNALGLTDRAKRVRAALVARFPGHPLAQRLNVHAS